MKERTVFDCGIPSVTIITHFPSPYQVELFDAVAARGEIKLTVIYLCAASLERRWTTPAFHHEAVYAEGLNENLAEAKQRIAASDFLVVNYYRNPLARASMAERVRSGRAWAFWGERLGFRSSRLVGLFYRRWALCSLSGSLAPIWGIGRWAVESYQIEFGRRRMHYNLPYFSNLARFTAVSGRGQAGERVRFLYSGSLIDRKGVDLLAAAFRRLAEVDPRVSIRFLGDGPLLPSLRKNLRALGDKVEFLGFRDWTELPAVYREADVLCAPSRHDGWGLIVPEAMAAGLPVIGTTSTGAAREFLRTGHNGWLVPAGNGEALFQAMRESVLSGPERRACMSYRAQEAVADHTVERGAMRLVTACRSGMANWKN